jgi:PPK2 family polyphosphate:nucleotide phosphotransferase
MGQSHRFDTSKFIVKPGKQTPLSHFDPGYTGQIESKGRGKETLREDIQDLAEKQELLWATKQHSLLIIFQAMDAAGKDGTIKHVMSGINPQGCSVFAFKAPSEEERLHHFLWRPEKFLPPRGMITIFNRSYYEEVLVVRVHPELLTKSWLPVSVRHAPLDQVWKSRFEEINAFEKRLTDNGISVIKFFLNVSKKEQLKRFLARLENPEKRWKFSPSDFEERKYWNDYQRVYEEAMNATSTDYAPWYVIPADNKWYTRAVVADIIEARIEALDLQFPSIPPGSDAKYQQIIKEFRKELEES